MGGLNHRAIYLCKGHKKSLLTGGDQKHAFYSAGVKERDKKKLRIRMDIRKAAKAATAVSPEGSIKTRVRHGLR